MHVLLRMLTLTLTLTLLTGRSLTLTAFMTTLGPRRLAWLQPSSSTVDDDRQQERL